MGASVTERLSDLLEHVIATIGTSEDRLYEQVNTSFHWLLGTLFAANGGAVVALVSRDVLTSKTSLALFAAGVVFSILMGLANTVYASKAIMPITDLRMTLTLLAAGQAAPEQLQEKMEALDEFLLIKRAMYGAGLLSLVLLTCGMIAFACTV